MLFHYSSKQNKQNPAPHEQNQPRLWGSSQRRRIGRPRSLLSLVPIRCPAAAAAPPPRLPRPHCASGPGTTSNCRIAFADDEGRGAGKANSRLPRATCWELTKSCEEWEQEGEWAWRHRLRDTEPKTNLQVPLQKILQHRQSCLPSLQAQRMEKTGQFLMA